MTAGLCDIMNNDHLNLKHDEVFKVLSVLQRFKNIIIKQFKYFTLASSCWFCHQDFTSDAAGARLKWVPPLL